MAIPTCPLPALGPSVLSFLIHTAHFPYSFPGCLLSRPTFLTGVERGKFECNEPEVIFIESDFSQRLVL